MEQTSAKLVNDAIRAMIYEVSVNPKPGTGGSGVFWPTP
jgi:hypothetical protein